ncbi:sensor histidine kinase [Mucilaginibacter agri]|uniref:Signal transduction histidine kinase internal region domain-containing protein n=1 Tax=Mucilaginibacter agri TaxID=2695265 RepID=A0A966DR20_9SPHI|nr:histidine kinase [Mucilaginibacter agri]NCD68573.1 hypothetical protein [Mucilaginibacter agri]
MTFNTLIGKLHTDPRYRVSGHLLFWTGELLVGWYTTVISFNSYQRFPDQSIWLLTLCNTLSLAIVYYPLVYVLLPMASKKRYMLALAGFVALVIVNALISIYTEQVLILHCDSCMLALKEGNINYYRFLQSNIFNRLFAKLATMGQLIGLVFSLSVPLAIHIALMAFRQQLAALRLAKENIELEFNFLSSQVNPHFLFNSLNNIYGLILNKENAKAADTVARLAGLMRYTLNPPDGDRSTLDKELRLLKDYIDLERIRLNYARVLLHVDIRDPQKALPVLLFMPLVENAFKYSPDIEGSIIRIKITSDDSTLHLIVKNRIDEDRLLQERSGIGLQNLNKRLGLHYPGKHTYSVDRTDENYTANIILQL